MHMSDYKTKNLLFLHLYWKHWCTNYLTFPVKTVNILGNRFSKHGVSDAQICILTRNTLKLINLWTKSVAFVKFDFYFIPNAVQN